MKISLDFVSHHHYQLCNFSQLFISFQINLIVRVLSYNSYVVFIFSNQAAFIASIQGKIVSYKITQFSVD